MMLYYNPGPLAVLAVILVAAVFLVDLISKKDYMQYLFPLSAGLLSIIMRQFYWDRVDFKQRVELLLIISLLFSLVLAIRRYRLLKKFLFFFNRLSLKRRSIGILVFSEILFIIAAYIITQKGVTLGGDEPHYLVISQSIARDFDINVFNQYARDEYREFIDMRISHHARVGKGFKVWYSYGHLPGLSLTTAPFFLEKIPHPLLYFLIRAYLGLYGALLAMVVYLFALKLWRNRSLAVFITAVFTCTAPVFFYSIHVFAEVQACLLVLTALYLLLYSSPQKKYMPLLAGFLLGISVFWGLRYSIFIYLLAGGFFVYYVLKKQVKRAILLAIFPLLFQLLFFGYLYYAYGNFDPMSIYNGLMTPEQTEEYESNMQKIPLQKRVETLLGIFFDQRDGLLLYNPFYFLAFPGLILAIRKLKTYRPHLLISGAGIVFVFFQGYSTVRAGYCPQARYLTTAIWVLMLLAIIFYKETRSPALKKLTFYLPVVSVLVVLYQVIHPFTLYQGATHADLHRPALMFQQWSNIYMNIPTVLPSFVKVPGNFRYLPNIVFLVLVVVSTFLLPGSPLRQAITKRFSRASHSTPRSFPNSTPSVIFSPGRCRKKEAAVLAVLYGLVFTVAAWFPRVPTYNPVLVAKEGAVPYRIYGESPYPTRVAERKLEIKGENRYSYTLSTLKPASSMVLEFENREGKRYEVSITDFDTPVEKVMLAPGTTQRVLVKNPGYKKFKNNCFYRIHVRVEPAPPGDFPLYLLFSINN